VLTTVEPEAATELVVVVVLEEPIAAQTSTHSQSDLSSKKWSQQLFASLKNIFSFRGGLSHPGGKTSLFTHPASSFPNVISACHFFSG
jgi:hypothetical protein